MTQISITFRDRALEWYIGLTINIPQGAPTTVAYVKKAIINEFQQPNSEDQFMNEMIGIKENIGESFSEFDQKFKILKGKLYYPIVDMKHRHIFVNSLLPHLKYLLRKKKFQTQDEALQEAL
jgi:hypothetical protein